MVPERGRWWVAAILRRAIGSTGNDVALSRGSKRAGELETGEGRVAAPPARAELAAQLLLGKLSISSIQSEHLDKAVQQKRAVTKEAEKGPVLVQF